LRWYVGGRGEGKGREGKGGKGREGKGGERRGKEGREGKGGEGEGEREVRGKEKGGLAGVFKSTTRGEKNSLTSK
jgi:hypothetical protein